MLSILIKHVDHKSVTKQPDMQLDIFEVTACLADLSKAQPSVATIGAISDLMRHLRKSMQHSFNNDTSNKETVDWNNKYQSVVDKCLVELSKKVLLISSLECKVFSFCSICSFFLSIIWSLIP